MKILIGLIGAVKRFFSKKPSTPIIREQQKILNSIRREEFKRIKNKLNTARNASIAKIEVAIERQEDILYRLQGGLSSGATQWEINRANDLRRKVLYNKARLLAVKNGRRSHDIDITSYIRSIAESPPYA